MSSISCACHIMKLARDSFRLKSKSVYGRSESWPTCFSNVGGKKKEKERKKKLKTEEVQISRPTKSRVFVSPRQDLLFSMREQGG